MPSSSFPYNFSDYSGDMHGDLKPSNHMDIPAGELHLLCDADSNSPAYANLSLSFIAQRKNFFSLAGKRCKFFSLLEARKKERFSPFFNAI